TISYHHHMDYHILTFNNYTDHRPVYLYIYVIIIHTFHAKDVVHWKTAHFRTADLIKCEDKSNAASFSSGYGLLHHFRYTHHHVVEAVNDDDITFICCVRHVFH